MRLFNAASVDALAEPICIAQIYRQSIQFCNTFVTQESPKTKVAKEASSNPARNSWRRGRGVEGGSGLNYEAVWSTDLFDQRRRVARCGITVILLHALQLRSAKEQSAKG